MLQGKKKNITILVIGILNLILTLGAMFSMDKRLPLNVFKDFVLDKMVSRENLLIIPVIALILCIAQVFYRIKTMDKPVTVGKRVEDALFTIIVGVVILLGWLLVDVGYQYMPNHKIGFEVPVLSVILSCLAILIASIASIFPINKYKDVIGFRSKEAMADESIWRVANRFAAATFFVSALVLVFLAVYFEIVGFNWAYLACGIIFDIIIMIYAPYLYAKNIYNRKYRVSLDK